jgi:Protein of unknown function (DUF1573)
MKTGCFIFLLLALVSCKTKDIKKESDYVLSKDTLVFSLLNYTDTLNQVVYLKNYSNADIKILKIENGCGCTSAFLNDSIAKPNDSIPIQIIYSPFAVKDSGKIVKYITFRTDAKMPFKNLTLKGFVGKK